MAFGPAGLSCVGRLRRPRHERRRFAATRFKSAQRQMKKPIPMGPALFIFGSGGVICAVPTVPIRVRVK